MFRTVTESPRMRSKPMASRIRAAASSSSACCTGRYSRSMPPSGLTTGSPFSLYFHFHNPSMFTDTVTRSILGE